MELLGIHHLTAISAHIRENKRFFTDTLGMRLVKRSVNQDDVSAYHRSMPMPWAVRVRT
jgi:glyoxalase family protein